MKHIVYNILYQLLLFIYFINNYYEYIISYILYPISKQNHISNFEFDINNIYQIDKNNNSLLFIKNENLNNYYPIFEINFNLFNITYLVFYISIIYTILYIIPIIFLNIILYISNAFYKNEKVQIIKYLILYFLIFIFSFILNNYINVYFILKFFFNTYQQISIFVFDLNINLYEYLTIYIYIYVINTVWILINIIIIYYNINSNKIFFFYILLLFVFIPFDIYIYVYQILYMLIIFIVTKYLIILKYIKIKMVNLSV